MKRQIQTICMLGLLIATGCGSDNTGSGLDSGFPEGGKRAFEGRLRPAVPSQAFALQQIVKEKAQLEKAQTPSVKLFGLFDILISIVIGAIPSPADLISNAVDDVLDEQFPKDPSGVWSGRLVLTASSNCETDLVGTGREFRLAITKAADGLVIVDQDGFAYSTDNTTEVPFVAYRQGESTELSVLEFGEIIYEYSSVTVTDHYSDAEIDCTVQYWGNMLRDPSFG